MVTSFPLQRQKVLYRWRLYRYRGIKKLYSYTVVLQKHNKKNTGYLITVTNGKK